MSKQTDIAEQDEALDELLQDFTTREDLYPAVILQAIPGRSAPTGVAANTTVSGDGSKFALRMIDDKAPPNKWPVLRCVIRAERRKEQLQIAQMPEVEAALLAADPQNGAIRSLVGGFDCNRSKFNHNASLAPTDRVSSSSILARWKRASPASIVQDGPISFSALVTGAVAAAEKL